MKRKFLMVHSNWKEKLCSRPWPTSLFPHLSAKFVHVLSSALSSLFLYFFVWRLQAYAGIISLYWLGGTIESDENQLWQLQFCTRRITIVVNDKPNTNHLWFAIDGDMCCGRRQTIVIWIFFVCVYVCVTQERQRSTNNRNIPHILDFSVNNSDYLVVQ